MSVDACDDECLRLVYPSVLCQLLEWQDEVLEKPFITGRLHLGRRQRRTDCSISGRRLYPEAAAKAAAVDCVMTKLYANLQHHHHHHHHHHQVTFKVDQRGAFKAESMSSLSDVSDVVPPPSDVTERRQWRASAAQWRRRHSAVRRWSQADDDRAHVPTAAQTALHRQTTETYHQANEAKYSSSWQRYIRRPGNVTSPAGDAALFCGCVGGVSYHCDDSHVTSGRQNSGMVMSCMHSLTKTNPEVNRGATIAAASGNGIRTTTTLLELNQTVTPSSEAKEHGTTNGLLSADWKPMNGARSSSVTNKYYLHLLIIWVNVINDLWLKTICYVL